MSTHVNALTLTLTLTQDPSYGRSAAAGRGTITASHTACMRAEQGVASWRKKARELCHSSSQIAKNRFRPRALVA
eukprot:COSAG06_NODE_1604_length_8955_cov_51.674840_5_plen_75_part_00